MFKEIGQFAGMMRMLPKVREEMEQLQERLARASAEGDAGGGMVRVRVNGKMELTACTLSDEALRTQDRELLEDLILSAANQAVNRMRELVAEETGKMATNLGLPPGMGLPGLG